ncbi:PAS and ANTAR domain-containing protein [Oerskovia sp. M15]
MTTPRTQDDLGPALESILLAGGPQPVARYTLDVRSGTWWWSDELFVMHGFAPGEVVPTTELMLAHKHPDDLSRVKGVLAEVTRRGTPFSCTHRIIDAHGGTRTLGVVGQGDLDRETGRVTRVTGYFMDLTEAHGARVREEATAAIRASASHRAVIEQAKGAVMVLYGLSDDEAFALLRDHSSVTNEPVKELARRLLASMTDLGARTRPGTTWTGSSHPSAPLEISSFASSAPRRPGSPRAARRSRPS